MFITGTEALIALAAVATFIGAFIMFGKIRRLFTSRSRDPSDWQSWRMNNWADKTLPGPKITETAGNGWQFVIPTKGADPRYVTYINGPLKPGQTLYLDFRIDADEGTRIFPREHPAAQGEVSLYFQRKGDNMSATGKYVFYRWYQAVKREPLTPGRHTVSVSLAGSNWKAVSGGKTGTNSPAEFAAALANAERVGFVLGGKGGAGHGVLADGPARLTVLSWRIA